MATSRITKGMPVAQRRKDKPVRTPDQPLLNLRWERAAQFRARGLTKTESMRQAGFTGKSVSTDAWRLFERPEVQARTQFLVDQQFRDLQMGTNEILGRSAALARSTLKPFLAKLGIDVEGISDEELYTLQTVKATKLFGKDDKGNRVETGVEVEFKVRDPNPALRMLAEHKKIIRSPAEAADKIADALADRLRGARERRKQAE